MYLYFLKVFLTNTESFEYKVHKVYTICPLWITSETCKISNCNFEMYLSESTDKSTILNINNETYIEVSLYKKSTNYDRN